MYDQKLSVFNFLATVVYEAEALGINHEKIFHSIQGEKARAVVPAVVTNQINKTADLVVAADPGSNSEEILNFTLRRMGNLIFRSFDEETFVGVHQTPCKSYLDYKRKQVDSWYFGSDDEGDTKDSNKDIKKNISASFKKFLQLPLNKYAPME